MPNPTTFASARQHVGLAVETTQGTAISAPTVTVPVDKFDPFDQPTWIDDKALRGSMVDLYNVVQGVKHTEVDFTGPVFLDTFPYLLSNVFGDIVYSGTYTGSGTTTLSSSSTVGATSISTVASISGGTLIQIDTGTLSEVRLTTGVSGPGPFVVTFTNPLVSAHNSAVVVKPITTPFSAAFSVLNSGNGQPSSLTMFDFQGPTASTGTRAYPGMCVSELTMKGTVESTGVDYTAKALGWPSASATAFTSSPSTVQLQPAWEGQVGLNGTVSGAPILTVNEFEFAFKREIEMIYTAQNSQNPYFIQRGKLTASGRLNAVVNDETFLTYLNSNTQPQLQIIISNGLSGANLLSVQVDIQKAAFRDSKIQRGKAAVEYAANFDAPANTTNAGYSGGFSPVTVTVQNAVSATPGPGPF
jgi:hypothetical protein